MDRSFQLLCLILPLVMAMSAFAQDTTGKRLTLYISKPHAGEQMTAFRFAQDNGVSVFYWIDKDCDYALSGEVDKPTLARVASSVYKQLEP